MMVSEDKIDNVETMLVNEEIIESPISLLEKLAIAEENYRNKEKIYANEYNLHLLNTDWGKVNDGRVDEGLSKLSNQDMKKAYIESLLLNYKEDLVIAKLEYNCLLRMYEMMKKYSLDILR